MNVPILRRTGYDPRANLAFEEELFASLRADPAPYCMFYHCDACIVLGRSNDAADWVHLGAARADGIPVLRRISGGGAVYFGPRRAELRLLRAEKNASRAGGARPRPHRPCAVH